MIYYNQNDYEHIPYPSEANPRATIKCSGCGICSACMVVENMTEHKLSVEECTKFSLSVGGRDNAGTDMEKLAPPLCERFGLTFEATDDKEKVLDFLNNNRGMVIANPGGDRVEIFIEQADGRVLRAEVPAKVNARSIPLLAEAKAIVGNQGRVTVI